MYTYFQNCLLALHFHSVISFYIIVFTSFHRSGTWTVCQRHHNFSVPRLAEVSRNTNKYFIRLLLQHVRAPTSFEYLRTIHGVTYPTYREACVALGILRDDNEHRHAMRDALLTARPRALRQLLAFQVRFNNNEFQINCVSSSIPENTVTSFCCVQFFCRLPIVNWQTRDQYIWSFVTNCWLISTEVIQTPEL
jgi:hypothetical protein